MRWRALGAPSGARDADSTRYTGLGTGSEHRAQNGILAWRRSTGTPGATAISPSRRRAPSLRAQKQPVAVAFELELQDVEARKSEHDLILTRGSRLLIGEATAKDYLEKPANRRPKGCSGFLW